MLHASAPRQGRFITRLNSNDVLLGRGVTSNDNEGNVRFRRLVQSRKNEYYTTSRRQEKDNIARQIIRSIAEREGRFVRKIESLIEAEKLGVPRGATAWIEADEETALLKVKQALRSRDQSRSVGSQEPSSVASRSITRHTHSADAGSIATSKASLDVDQSEYRHAVHSSNQHPTFDFNMPSVIGTLPASSGRSNTNNPFLLPGESEHNHLSQEPDISERKPPGVERLRMSPTNLARNVNQSRERSVPRSPTSLSATEMDGIRCSLLDTLILTVMCTHGLPREPLDIHIYLGFQPKSRFRFTWFEFTLSLVQTAQSDYPDSLARDNSMWNALIMGKKSIMLVEKVRRLGQHYMERTQGEDTGENMEQKERLLHWMGKEIGQWTSRLGLRGPDGQPTELASADLPHPTEGESHDTALFTDADCGAIMLHVAFMTALRSVVTMPVVRHGNWLEETLRLLEASSPSRGFTVTQDLELIDGLMTEGFMKVMAGTTNSDQSGTVQQASSSQRQLNHSFGAREIREEIERVALWLFAKSM